MIGELNMCFAALSVELFIILFVHEILKSEKWDVSAWMINYYCAEGRIPGAMKMTTIWLFPKTAEKPMDMRTKQGRQRNENFYHRG